MSSYNYIGTTWAGACSGTLNGILRGEWGFNGMVLTDANGTPGWQLAAYGIDAVLAVAVIALEIVIFKKYKQLKDN